jgi:hypothetical protein
VNDSTKARLAYQLRQAQRDGHQVTEAELSHLKSLRIQTLGEELADARAAARLKASVTVTSEPKQYSRHGEFSWFRDVWAAEFRSNAAAKARLARHEKEMAAEEPHRKAARQKAADEAYERAFAATAYERRILSEYADAGGRPFERRALDRIDGAGGFGVVPGWLIDEYVPPARAESQLMQMVHQMPLPSGVDEINVPILSTGSQTGPVADLVPPAQRDWSDLFAGGKVITVGGQVDAPAIWTDVGSGAPVGGDLDQIVFGDLMADADLNLDGLLIAGDGGNTQPLGLFPPASTVGTSLAVFAPNGCTEATQQFSYNGGSGTPLLVTLMQAVSGINRARGRYPSAILAHGSIAAILAAQVDQQSRPLLPMHGPKQAAAETEADEGVLLHVGGLPLYGDNNIPLTFGGTYTPPARPYVTGSGSQFAVKDGTGASAIYSPLIPLIPDDMHLWLSEPRMRLLREVTAGTLGVRYQCYRYAVFIPNRYQALESGTLANSGGWAKGAITSYGVVTQEGSNSLLSVSGQGF